MPRPPRVQKEDAIKTVEDFIENFKTAELPQYTSNVWVLMSEALGSKWNAHDVYTAVREDRRQILSIARERKGIVIPANIVQNCSAISDDSFVDSIRADPDFEILDNPEFRSIQTSFPLVLDAETWKSVKPDGTVKYGPGKKEYQILAPDKWTDIIFDLFFTRYRFPCAYIFKRAKIHASPDSKHYMLIYGLCKSKECSNPFFGLVEKQPGDGEAVEISVKTRDTSRENHEKVKRPLRGLKRKAVGRVVAVEGVSNYKKRTARENLRIGEPEPPNFYKSTVLDRARKEHVDDHFGIKPRDGDDVIKTITDMKRTPPYAGSILEVGADSFFVLYTTTPQIHAYNEYCRLAKWPSAKIDSTGSLIRKIKRANNVESGHIFLTAIVINFGKKTLLVGQMISETLTTEFIEWSLRRWQRSGARIPKEAVSDYSRALLSAMCLAFNNQTLKQYIRHRFMALTGGVCLEEPATYVRVDVAHLINAVCRWKCFKHVSHPCIRELYIRCIALMVDAETLSELEELIFFTVAVAVNEHEDTLLSPRKLSVKTGRKELEAKIASGDKSFEIPKQEKHADSNDVEYVLEQEEHDKEQSTLSAWSEEIYRNSKSVMREGSDLNPFYLPKFAERLMGLVLEFPLWSKVVLPNNVVGHSSTSSVEGYFHDLKARILKGNPLIRQLPMRADRFLKAHLQDILGAVISFESSLTDFKVDQARKINDRDETPNDDQLCLNESSTEIPVCIRPLDDSDLKTHENWRQKGDYAKHEFNGAVVMDDDSGNGEIPDCAKNLDDYDAELDEDECIEAETEEALLDEVLSLEDDTHCFSPSTSHFDSEKEGVYNEIEVESLSPGNSASLSTVIASVPTDDKPEDLKKKSYYFKKVPEIGYIHEQMPKGLRNNYLLINGSLLPMIKFENRFYKIYNTCPFDSVAQVMLRCVFDDKHYASALKESQNQTAQFVIHLAQTGPRAKNYQERAAILIPHYEPSNHGNYSTSVSIDCRDSVALLWKKLFMDAPSAVKHFKCANPQCGFETDDPLPYFGVDFVTIAKEGFGALQKAMRYSPMYRNVPCKAAGCLAKGNLTVTTREHLLIELDVRVRPSFETLGCQLRDLPATIDLNNRTYRLGGIQHWQSDHFIGYSRRINGNWEINNDLDKKIKPVSDAVRVNPVAAFYVMMDWRK